MRFLFLTMLLVLCVSLSACATLADQILTPERAKSFASKALEVVGPAVKDLLTDKLLEEATRRTAADREKLLAAAAKRNIDWKEYDYDGDGAIEAGGEHLDLLRAVEEAAESSGLPLSPGETGGAAATLISMAALWIENRRRQRASKSATEANEDADVTVRGVKSLRKKARDAKVLIGDQVKPLSEIEVVYEGQQQNVDAFIRGIMRSEAEDAGVQERMHQRVKRVAG